MTFRDYESTDLASAAHLAAADSYPADPPDPDEYEPDPARKRAPDDRRWPPPAPGSDLPF